MATQVHDLSANERFKPPLFIDQWELASVSQSDHLLLTQSRGRHQENNQTVKLYVGVYVNWRGHGLATRYHLAQREKRERKTVHPSCKFPFPFSVCLLITVFSASSVDFGFYSVIVCHSVSVSGIPILTIWNLDLIGKYIQLSCFLSAWIPFSKHVFFFSGIMKRKFWKFLWEIIRKNISRTTDGKRCWVRTHDYKKPNIHL